MPCRATAFQISYPRGVVFFGKRVFSKKEASLLYKFILKRLLWVIPIMLGVLIVVFTITYLTPGDPVLSRLGNTYTQEQYDAMAAKMGLDKGYLGQLSSYIVKVVTKFDFGVSFANDVRITDEISARFPITLSLGILSITIGIALGVPLGVLSAVKQYSVTDVTLTAIALLLAAIPSFVLALLALLYFGVYLKWLPIIGLKSFKHWILPVITGSMPGVAAMMRMTRTTMLEVLRQDYIRTANAKGLKKSTVIFRHALKNCLIPIVTMVGTTFAIVIGGSVIVETIFAIPGMGTYMMKAIQSRDYPVINACVLLIAAIVCVINLAVDLIYAFIDPRIKAIYSASSGSRQLEKIRGAAGGEEA